MIDKMVETQLPAGLHSSLLATESTPSPAQVLPPPGKSQQLMMAKLFDTQEPGGVQSPWSQDTVHSHADARAMMWETPLLSPDLLG